MDEATSALDMRTEKLVVEAIDRMKGEKTLILIAHRLSTIRHCDRIIILETGVIVEDGTFEEVVCDT